MANMIRAVFPPLVRKDATLTTSVSSFTLYVTDHIGSFTFSYTGDGVISVSSSNTNVATVTRNGTTVTVTYVVAGSATITISAPQTQEYNAVSATVKVYCEQLTPTLTMDAKSSYVLDSGNSLTFTYSYNGDGNVYVKFTPSDYGVVSSTISGNKVTISYTATTTGVMYTIWFRLYSTAGTIYAAAATQDAPTLTLNARWK